MQTAPVILAPTNHPIKSAHVGVGRVAVALLDEVRDLLAHERVAAAVLVGADAAGKRAEELARARDRVGREELADLGVRQQERRRAERDDLARERERLRAEVVRVADCFALLWCVVVVCGGAALSEE